MLGKSTFSTLLLYKYPLKFRFYFFMFEGLQKTFMSLQEDMKSFYVYFYMDCKNFFGNFPKIFGTQ